VERTKESESPKKTEILSRKTLTEDLRRDEKLITEDLIIKSCMKKDY